MKKFLGNVKQEFRKITWPTDKEMKTSTAQVFVFMVVLSLFFAGLDAIISTGVNAASNDDPAPIVEEWEGGDYSDLNDLLNGDYNENGDDGDYDENGDYDEDGDDETGAE